MKVKRVALIMVSTALILVIGATPVFAYGQVNNLNVTTVLKTDGSNTGQLSNFVQIAALTPHINGIGAVSNDGEYEYVSGSGMSTNTTPNSRLMVDIEQEFVVMLRIVNTSSQTAFVCNTGYGQVSATLNAPTNVSAPKLYTGVEVKEVSGNMTETITSIGSTTTGYTFPIQFRWNPEYVYNGNLVIPKGSTLHSNIIFSLHTYVDVVGTSSTDAFSNQMYPANWAYSLNTVSFDRPTSDHANLISNFTLENANYNSIMTVEELEDMNDELDSIYTQLVNTREAMSQALSTSNTRLLNIINLLTTINGNVDNLEGYTDDLEMLLSDIKSINTNIFRWERLNTLLMLQMMNNLNGINPQLDIDVNFNGDLNTTFQQANDDEDEIIQQYTVYLTRVDWNPLGTLNYSDVQTSNAFWKNRFTGVMNNIGPFKNLILYSLTLTLGLYMIQHKLRS